MASIGFSNFYFSKNSLEKAHLAGLEAIADLKRERIERFYNDLRADIRVAQEYYNIKANLPIILNLSNDKTNPSYVEAMNMLNGQFRTWATARNEILDLMLVSPEGKVVYAANPEHEVGEVDHPLADSVKLALLEGTTGVYLSDIFRHHLEEGQFAMIISGPAHDLKGRFIGVIALEINMDEIYASIQNITGLGETGETLLGKKVGEKALFLNPLRHDKDAALTREAVFGDRNARPIQEAVSGRDGSGLSVDYRGKDIIAVWRYIPSMNWGLVAKMDASEAFAPIEQLKKQTIIIVALTILIALITIYVIAESISSPIRLLKGLVQKIGEGDLATRSDLKGNDEISSLAKGINSMAENLSISQENLRGIFENTSAVIFLKDIEGRYLMINRRFEELFETKKNEIVGKTDHDIFPKEMADSLRLNDIKALESEDPVELEEYVPHEDGSKHTYLSVKFKIHDSSGAPYAICGIATDITDRKEAEENLEIKVAQRTNDLKLIVKKLEDEISNRENIEGELKESEGMLAMAQEVAKVGSWYWDPPTDALSWSDETCRQYGVNPDTIKPSYEMFESFVHPDDLDRANNDVRLALEGKKDYDLEVRMFREDGTEWIMHTQGKIIRNEKGEPVRFLGTQQDITKQREAEEEIIKHRENLEGLVKERTQALEKSKEAAEVATKAKSEFLANMSHEIRTPMTSVLGMAELLSETKLSKEQLKHVDHLTKSGDSLVRIINDILDLSKVEAGMIELEEINFSFGEKIEKIFSVFSIKADKKGIKLKKNISSNVPDYFFGDPVRLRQILINLIGNSIKFTDSGEVTISAECEKPAEYSETCHLLISISDTGIGIPEDKLNTIFQEFSQGDSSTTRTHGGTGLGLSISKKLVELMGGRLEVKSKEGEGSTFYFNLNMRIGSHEEEPEKELGAPITEGKEGPLNILLAEDAEDNRLLVKAFLKDTPHKLDMAENGEKAVEMFTAGEYDLILMDMQMPVMDGYTATRVIRGWENRNERKSIPIVAFTAHALKEEVEKCLESGCTNHLAKPIKKKDLIEAIQANS